MVLPLVLSYLVHRKFTGIKHKGVVGGMPPVKYLNIGGIGTPPPPKKSPLFATVRICSGNYNLRDCGVHLLICVIS